ncbi:MAG: hypothetical protein JW808_04765 [Victivallales bacterium]|nr:hypothetical protein [Victivallales bacterium]
MRLRCLVCAASVCALTFTPYASASGEGKQEKYSTPLQLSFFAPLQIAPENSDVYGLRLCLPYGVNHSLHGADIGIWNVLTGKHHGVQIGALATMRGGKAYGWNIAGIANMSDGDDFGVSFGGIYNNASGSINGVQLSAIHSRAKKVKGVQFSLFNYCDELEGVQVGLLNFCPQGAIPFMLLINAKF